MGRNSTVRFGSFEFHYRRSELCFEGERVPLQEQPRKVLALLLATPGKMVSRERIRKALWDGDHGDHEHGINTAIRKLRRVLDGKVPGLRLETSAGRGYRLFVPEGVQGRHQAALDKEGLDAFLTGQFLFEQSCEHMLTLAPGNPTFLGLLAHAQAGLSKTDAMRATVELVNELSGKRYVSPTARAMAALAASDATDACKAVREAATQRDANFALYHKMRLFDLIRRTPDFVSTLTTMRL